MQGAKTRLDRQAWLRVYRTTGIITAIAVILSIVITNVIMETFSAGINVQGLVVSIVTPIILGVPAVAITLYQQEQLRTANAQLQKLASYDWLTKCLSRGAFTNNVSTALRNCTSTCALLVIDVDHFKSINDNHGHDRGDDALILIASTLQQTAGEGIPVGRLGGEEFGILLRGASHDQAVQMAEKLRAAVARLAFVTEGNGCPLSISIGGATCRGAMDFRTLYKMADTCLYQAKAAGRDRSVLTDTTAPAPDPTRSDRTEPRSLSV